jgi:hypothetical protein
MGRAPELVVGAQSYYLSLSFQSPHELQVSRLKRIWENSPQSRDDQNYAPLAVMTLF